MLGLCVCGVCLHGACLHGAYVRLHGVCVLGAWMCTMGACMGAWGSMRAGVCIRLEYVEVCMRAWFMHVQCLNNECMHMMYVCALEGT